MTAEEAAPSPSASHRIRDGGGWGAASTAVLGLLLVLLVAVAGAGASIAAPPAPLAVLVVFLPYLCALHGVLVFAAWTAFPDRRGLPVLMGALAVVVVVLWAPGPSRWRPVPDGLELRVQTWNLQRLWGAPDALACAEEGIEGEGADVVVLLEVSADDVSRLASDLGMGCAHHPYTSAGGSKAGGLAVCTRSERWAMSSGEGQRFVDDEDWYYLFSEIRSTTAPDRVVNVLGVHLYPYRTGSALRRRTPLSAGDLMAIAGQGEVVSRGQSDQVAALLQRVRRLSDPTVIAGDFNSTRDAALHHELRRTLTDAWRAGGLGFGGTVRLLGLPLRVDHVYTTADLGVRETRVPVLTCSDHRPVVADVVLKAAP
ncbi:MAG: endonuclease/exonuclease/phosphatase family protein [Myxococcales bacterium]|nr:endonuclease/exonuclease/phosphatase family protein [Myxococcales bacterium]